MSSVIPWSKIVEYSDRMGYDADEGDAFVTCIRRLNFVYHKARTTKSPMGFLGAATK